MNWIVAVFMLTSFVQFLSDLRNASRGEVTVTINSSLIAIKIIFCAVVMGFLLYFLRRDLMVQMNWFFVAVFMLYGLIAFISLLMIGDHGKRKSIDPGSSAFAALIGAAVATGFGYVFFALTF